MRVLMRIKVPSVATVLASLALLVSLCGAIAAGAVPLAKKALFANNAGKLQGKTAAAIVATPGPAKTLEGKTLAEIVAMPGPANTFEGKTLAKIVAMPGPADSLNGKTADQIAAMPGPASTAVGLVTTATAPVSIPAEAEGTRTVSCPTGGRAVGGGWKTDEAVFALDSYPSSDTGWSVYLVNPTDHAASGTLYAVCLT